MLVPNFKTPINIQIKRFPDGEVFTLQSIDQSQNISDEDIETIVKCCNEDLVYKILFKEKFNNKPYTLENCEWFINWAKEGWSKNEWFVFLIRDSKNNIVGAVDIKSSNLESAEVGYWLSNKVTGVMTNALGALCNLAKGAGYKSVYGLTVVGNIKSQNVLTRAGFSNVGEIEVKETTYLKFVKSF